MKKTIFLTGAFVLGWLSVAMAQVWVNPHTRKDGTQVQGHYQSNPDGNPYNNRSYGENVNRYNGKQPTDDPNRYLELYPDRNDQGYGTHPDRYYQFEYRW
ncbi:MAG: hypothetical protein ACM3TN_18660 [Alphaproteobacteria bacterium]